MRNLANFRRRRPSEIKRTKVQLPETNCARTRESLSAQLDGELPELEVDRLETHLLICPECSTWAEQVRDVTGWLREAPLEEPAGRFALPRLRRSWRVSSAVAVASAAAVVATMFVAPAQRPSSQQSGFQVTGFVGATGQHYTISRFSRLEDGMFVPVTTARVGFKHV
jgi:predicted anti-sigma-YlaC factor YlaD